MRQTLETHRQTHPQLILFIIVFERLKDVPHESTSRLQAGPVATIPLLYEYRGLHGYIDRHFQPLQRVKNRHATHYNVYFFFAIYNSSGNALLHCTIQILK